MPLSSVGCWHRLFYNSPCTSSAHCWSPGTELRSSSLVWGFCFFFFCSSSVFYFMAWFQGHLRKLPLEYKVVAGYLTCSSLSFGHWLVPWTFFLMTASWLTASSCTCSRASGCFCLELKKSPNHKLSVTFQLRVTPGKLWQIQTQCTSSEIRGKSESIYTRTNA